MTVRCTVCGENFKAWSDGEDMCGKCRVLVEDERRQAEAERTCLRCAESTARTAAAKRANG